MPDNQESNMLTDKRLQDFLSKFTFHTLTDLYYGCMDGLGERAWSISLQLPIEACTITSSVLVGRLKSALQSFPLST